MHVELIKTYFLIVLSFVSILDFIEERNKGKDREKTFLYWFFEKKDGGYII